MRPVAGPPTRFFLRSRKLELQVAQQRVEELDEIGARTNPISDLVEIHRLRKLPPSPLGQTWGQVLQSSIPNTPTAARAAQVEWPLVFALGLIAALAASVLFNIGIALQAIEARAAPTALALRVSLLVRLLQRPRWILGWVLGIVGIGPQVLALAEAPFVVVQPALAAGLLILLVLGSRTFGEQVGVVEVAGVLAIIGGIALVAWGAPTHSEAHRGGAAVVGVVAAISVCSAVPFAVRRTRFDRGMVAIVASGCAFAGTNVVTKLMTDALGGSRYATAAAWSAAGLALGIAATVTEMTAFQRCRATTVVPVATAVQTFLPIVLEPLFLSERWSDAELKGLPIVAGLAVALAGTVLVSRTPAVSGLAAGASGN